MSRSVATKATLITLAAASTLLAVQPVNAMPSVSGLTISWPGDDYYQVQRASDYSTVCEGTQQCRVSAGEYIVINHTTQQRFEGVMVAGSTEGGGSSEFQIVGNTLVFPEGDWYQVQDAVTNLSLCNGALECLVESGSYTVINHTLGQRYEKVVVGESEGPEVPVTPGVAPTVMGNVISWADDGWYQVQNSLTFASECEGGRECEVAPGTYRVINLTTNTRFENIVVQGDGPVEPVVPPVTQPLPTGTYPSTITAADANLQASDGANGSVLPSGAIPAGDINGDGLDDIIMILQGQQSFETSAAILFADAQGSYPDLPLDADLNTNDAAALSNGFVINDVSQDVSGVGDVNGDGFDDLSLQSSGFFTLAQRVVLAGAASFSARFSTDDLPADQLLVQLPVSGSLIEAGDINGDGIGDLFVAAPRDAIGGVIYGASGLDISFADRTALRALSVFPGCAGDFCSTQPVGDFDGDGFDDLYVSRLGANGCGYSSYTAILYGEAGGITRRDNIYDYTADQVTRIVGEKGGSCFPVAVAGVTALGDVDGDGAADLMLETRFSSRVSHLIFGMSDRRREFVSIDELDGQLGVTIDEAQDVALRDVNNDGFDDVVFEDGSAYAGFGRDISSIEGPVVRRTPAGFTVYLPASQVANGPVSVSVNDVFAAEFDAGTTEFAIDDLTGGAEAVVAVTVGAEGGAAANTVRRIVPAYANSENVTATLLAPRLIEITINGDLELRRLGQYLVWRNGVPIGRSLNGADNYIDEDLELGRTYTYFVTPDYLYDDSLDASLMSARPLLQRQSNSVTISTPAQ